MINIKEEITENLQAILKNLGLNTNNVIVEVPQDLERGDFTSNIALQVSKDLNLSPRELAQKIQEAYPLGDNFEKIEIAGPGFINFYLSKSFLLNEVQKISQKGSEYFKMEKRKGERCMIEYTDPNPFKILHIGHLYTNMVGESFARLQEALGAQVYRANYQGDVGLHVAKTMYGLKLLLEKDGISFVDLKERELSERVSYLGDAYMLGFNHYDDLKEEKAIAEIRKINRYIFSFYVSSINERENFDDFEKLGMREWYILGKEWCMEYFERIYSRTGTKFDNYYLESEMSGTGLKIVQDNTRPRGKCVFQEDEGSIIFKGDESKGLHTRVFINKEGLPTYEAKELALAFKKFEDRELDESVVITADEQSAYFKVVLEVLSQIEPDIASRSKHFPHGMVKLPGAEKMSSRKGKIIGGEWLLDKTKEKVSELMKKTEKFSSEEIEEKSDRIAVAAIKYAFLKVSVGKDVVFDFDKSISFDGDTGPYLLYVYARSRSLLENQNLFGSFSAHFEPEVEIEGLIRQIVRYRNVLLSSSLSYSPNTLASYLFDLAQAFNSFYQNVRVLDSEEEEDFLLIVDATAKTMKHGLNILGIDVVERM